MGCCGEDAKLNTMRLDTDDLPEETIFCMTRMAYTMTLIAEHFYTGRTLAMWDALTPPDQAEFVRKGRLALRGTTPEKFQPTDLLFFGLLRTLVTTV